MLLAKLALPAFLAVTVQAQIATVRSSGQYDTDGTILYSVYVATAERRLEGVAVGGTVPLGTRFVEALDLPSGVVFEGVRDNVAVWSLPEIPADRLIGPFTFRAKPDGAATITAEPPAAVSYRSPEAGIVEYSGTDKPLRAPETKGSHIFDQRGTLDDQGKNAPVEIGRTGVFLFVPEGAVRTQTTVSVEREEIDPSKLPSTENPTWWCGLYRLTISPQEQTAKSFAFAFPVRRPLTPGLPIQVAANDDGRWSKSEVRASGFGLFGSNFSCGMGFGFNTCSGPLGPCTGSFCGLGLGQFGFGVLSADRARATVSSTQLSAVFGVPTTPTTAIQDGTSNTFFSLMTGRP